MNVADQRTSAHENVFRLLVDGSAACRRAQRDDLVELLEIAVERLRRPTTVVCVVGEYKQGKSLLINSLIGADACRVDDDLATTAITVVSHDSQGDEGARAGSGDAAELGADGGAGRSGPAGDVDVDVDVDVAASDPAELVELSVPSAFLEQGIAIVDTPGVNAFEANTSSAVLDFLPWADGLVLVSDASAELSPPELRFLSTAVERCPTVVVAQTKIDLYPEWRRIVELNRRHLADLDLDVTLVPVSALLSRVARRGRDESLAAESGLDDLGRTLEREVIQDARRRVAGRALHDLDRAVNELRSVEAARLATLETPARADERIAQVREAQEFVSSLDEADAHWVVLLDERFTALGADLGYQLHHEMLTVEQHLDRLLVESSPSDVMDEVLGQLRMSVSRIGHETVSRADAGMREIAREISALITSDGAIPVLERAHELEVDRLWSAVEPDLQTTGPGLLVSGLGVLLSGASMTGMLQSFFSIALGPISLAAAAVYGAHQFWSGRSTVKERQRDEARSVVRGLLDRAEVELSRLVDQDLHDARQALRELFRTRIAEMSETYASAVRAMEEARDADGLERTRDAELCRRRIEQLDDFASRVAAEASFVT